MELATLPQHDPPESAEEFNLHAFVAGFADDSDEPDVGVLTDAIAAAIPEEALRSALRLSLRRYVSLVVARKRHKGHRPVPVGTRWDAVQAARDSGALGLLRMRVSVGGEEWKFLEDCSRADIEGVAAAGKKRALEHAQQAQRFAALAREMEARGAATVADVPLDRIVVIFNA